MRQQHFVVCGVKFAATISEPSGWNLDQQPVIQAITIVNPNGMTTARITLYLLRKWFIGKPYTQLERQLTDAV